jgi:hypothetical protein
MKYQDKWKSQYPDSLIRLPYSDLDLSSKKNKKTLILSVLRLLCDFLSLKNDVNYLQ